MASVTIAKTSTLGPLEFDESGYADTHIVVGGRHVAVLVMFQEGVDEDALASADALMGKAAALDESARRAMAEDLASGDADGATTLYKSHSLEACAPEDLRRVFPDGVERGLDDHTFLAALRLVDIAIHPDDPDELLVFDYSLGKDITNYLLAVAFDANGSIVRVDLES